MADLSGERIKGMARMAIEALEDKKAEDIRVIDISRISVLADYFIIASGNNRNQIQTLCDAVEEKLGRAGYPVKQIEGSSIKIILGWDIRARPIASICCERCK